MARPEKQQVKESAEHPIATVFIEHGWRFSINKLMFSSKNSHKRTNKRKK